MAKVISTLLSLLILLSTSGVTYAQHFCGGNEVAAEITLGEVDLSCGMAMEDGLCCQDHKLTIETDDNFSGFSFTYDLNYSFQFYLPNFSTFLSFSEPIIKNEFYSDYSPPPLERDLNILYDTFLI